MSKFRSGMHKFNVKGHLNSNKFVVRNRFMKFMDSKLGEVYDSYVDFVISMYDKMNDREDSSYLHKVYDVVSADIEKSSKKLLDEHYDFSDTITYELLDECLQDLFTVNCYSVMNYCRTSCLEFMMNNLKNLLEDASETEDFYFLKYYDNAFLRMFRLKFDSLKDSCLEFMKYTDSTLLDDCYYNVTYSLKDVILESSYENLKNALPDEITIDKESISEGVLKDFGIKAFDECVHDLEEEDEEINNSENLVFIDDYRDLNRIAENSGFECVRYNGDHGIFKSANGMVVIPQGRSIGKGLSIKIQKTINRYKAC